MDNAIPTDSVLRRHYESAHNETKQSQSSQNGGGFMCWIKRLFGG
ncbi:MAG: hypothetical protein ACRBDX_08825 [Gammaproteobacteria bacterium]